MEEDIKKLLEENLTYTKEIYKYARSTRRMVMFDQVMSVVKIVLIIVPLILGFLFLAPYLKQTTQIYGDLLEGGLNDLNANK